MTNGKILIEAFKATNEWPSEEEIRADMDFDEEDNGIPLREEKLDCQTKGQGVAKKRKPVSKASIVSRKLSRRRKERTA